MHLIVYGVKHIILLQAIHYLLPCMFIISIPVLFSTGMFCCSDNEMVNYSDVSSVLANHFSEFPISSDIDQANRVVVRRKHIWKDTLRALSRSNFDCGKSVHVTFLGEQAEDAGGPKREFFNLALQAMANDGQIFHGPCNRRSFVHNIQAITEQKFFFSGMLVAISLGNGGPGFPCMAEAVCNYLGHGLGPMVQPEVEDVPDFEIRAKLERVSTGHRTKYMYLCGAESKIH